jgi:hypothetical protein
MHLRKIIMHMAKKGAVKASLIAKWAALKVATDKARNRPDQHDEAYWTNAVTQKVKTRFPNAVISDQPAATAPPAGGASDSPFGNAASMAAPPSYDESNMEGRY